MDLCLDLDDDSHYALNKLSKKRNRTRLYELGSPSRNVLQKSLAREKFSLIQKEIKNKLDDIKSSSRLSEQLFLQEKDKKGFLKNQASSSFMTTDNKYYLKFPTPINLF
jgi:hypothetical protein